MNFPATMKCGYFVKEFDQLQQRYIQKAFVFFVYLHNKEVQELK